ncbi:hypothetical protein HYP85_gp072 [Pseudomonas phage Zuri]|uniref:Uncharacterized protein n=1 Tax=Pseudomonas phage Zuri TaxID=2604899 RepID=A0A5C1K5R1_9CAUD|nr:hypothetical protein HYP85_gp072 [Pseudomonas phage Zuri]QEM41095.1 hypothetical protein Zuri_101 [Pseudomonas phage Zuri]
MKIAYRLGNMGWAEDRVTTLDDLFTLANWPRAVFIARNQQDYDTLCGYELVYGVKLPLRREPFNADLFNIDEVFLWVDFPNNPD